MAHFIEVCKHGRVVRQCRCFGPKDSVIVPCQSPACDGADAVDDHYDRRPPIVAVGDAK